jgi:uncharacterized protein with von Willebrand factor type A (vWA) domain
MFCAVIPTAGVDLAAALRNSGLRVTASRVAVLSEVTEGKHMTADQVGLGARDRTTSCAARAARSPTWIAPSAPRPV